MQKLGKNTNAIPTYTGQKSRERIRVINTKTTIKSENMKAIYPVQKILSVWVGNFPAGFRVIDRFDNGVATSIKSIDLNAPTYQNAQALSSRLNSYVDSLAGWQGQTTPYGGVVIQPSQVTARTLQVAVPTGSMSAAQQGVFNAAAQRAQSLGINFITTPVP